MLRPRHVLEEIKRRREETDDPIRFYWVVIGGEDGGGDRGKFAASLRGRAAARPVLPEVLRTPGFMDSNSVMNDLVAVLESARPNILSSGMSDRIRQDSYLDVVLISRRELALAITSSPLVLPDWFPIRAGREVTAKIEDLTWTAGVSLSAPEARIGEMRRLLYELDRTLVERLRAVGERDHNLVRGLLDRVQGRNEGTLSLNEYVVATQAVLDRVRNPRDYRPSSRWPTTISRIWDASVMTHSDGLHKLAKNLAKGLEVVPGDVAGREESLLAVLGRPTNPMSDQSVRWAFDVIVTVGAACQLATAAAHADEYSRYPVRLVGSLSRHLTRALDGFVEMLEV